MNDGNRNVLRRYHEDLSKDIVVTEGLLGELYTVGVFKKDLIEIIRAQCTPSDKTQKLLELLPTRGPEALDKFIGVIEGSYPWLATVLNSAAAKSTPKTQERAGKAPSIANCKTSLSRSSLSLDDHQWSLVDTDIRKIVAAFVHKQFGQSKRVSEKDKKCVERFMADQIQKERTRYQSILTSGESSAPTSRSESVADNVFHATEVQESLYQVHKKLEGYVVKVSKGRHQGVNGSNPKNATHYNVDDDGHPDRRHSLRRDSHVVSSTANGQRGAEGGEGAHGGGAGGVGGVEDEEDYHPKLVPEDMDFDLVHGELDIVLKQMDMLENTIQECLNFFDSRDHHHTLPVLIQNLVTRMEYYESEMTQDRKQIKRLLDEIQNHTDLIDKLEKERLEHRKQIQAAYLDMASLRQDKCALQERVHKLEREKRANQQDDSSNSNKMTKLGFVNKAGKTTPRGVVQTHAGVGYVGNRNNYTTSSNCNTGVGSSGASSSMANEDGYARRSVSKTTGQRPGNAYLGYARRYPQGSSRYGINVSVKKKAKPDSFSQPVNFNSTAKF